MSNFDNFNTSDRALLEQMSTDDLNEILRQSTRPDSETDGNTVLLVLEVLEKREVTIQPEEVDAVWKQFERKHLEPDSIRHFEERHKPKHHKLISITKIAGIAAAVALVIFAAGSLITPVEGTNLWSVIVNWTKETLGIGTEGRKLEATEIPEQLVELNEYLQQYKLSGAVDLPSYIPARYNTTTTVVDDREDVIVLYCQLEDGNHSIVLQYRCWKDGRSATEVQKGIEDPEEFITGDGQKIYIVSNMDLFNAIWIKGDIECAIYGISSREELVKIISSI